MIISNPEDLNLYLPHTVSPAKGDKSLFDKISAHIIEADMWGQRKVCPESYLNKYARESVELWSGMRTIVANHALLSALASIDVVLTPNGIGVVSTETIAPASKERVNALREELMQNRDDAILRVLCSLLQDPRYQAQPAARAWMNSLFQPWHTIYTTESDRGFSLREYDKISARLNSAEYMIAEKSISHEIMRYLRSEVVSNIDNMSDDSENIWSVIDAVRQLAIKNIHNEKIFQSEYVALIDLIKEDQKLAGIWSGTRQARMYSLPEFKNDRNSGGFFF